jgi:hypothetical protein
VAKQVQPLVDALWTFADDLKKEDAAFAREFESIPKSFWSKVRKW